MFKLLAEPSYWYFQLISSPSILCVYLPLRHASKMLALKYKDENHALFSFTSYTLTQTQEIQYSISMLLCGYLHFRGLQEAVNLAALFESNHDLKRFGEGKHTRDEIKQVDVISPLNTLML